MVEVGSETRGLEPCNCNCGVGTALVTVAALALVLGKHPMAATVDAAAIDEGSGVSTAFNWDSAVELL